MADYGLKIRFEDQSPSYTYGFEAGMLYQRMLTESEIEMQIHSENSKQAKIMADNLGFRYDYEPVPGYPEYGVVTLQKKLKLVKGRSPT